MCAGLGISHIYTQTYHHKANGRSERVGQRIMEVLQKLNVDRHVNWVEAFPQLLAKFMTPLEKVA